MKKILFLLFVLTHTAIAQNKITGTWSGKLTVNGGISLRIVFHIQEQDRKLISKMDSPDKGINNIACDKTELNGNKLSIGLSNAGAAYEGVVSDDFKSTKGVWKQGNAAIPLDLILGENEKPEIKSQTPQPPFSYASEDIEFDNRDKSMHYGATFTYPKNGTSFPSVILITGSGRQDRDETIGLHKPFAVIADYLTKNGFGVLRIDDRGIGKTSTGTKNATTEDFAKDVEEAILYLKSRKEVNPKKIGLIGHSEGGMIAPMVASTNKSVAFIVMLAGPGIPISDLMTEQSEAVMRSSGIGEEALKAYQSLYKKEIVAIAKAPTEEAALRSANDIFQSWQSTTPKNIVTTTTMVTDSASRKDFASKFVKQIYSPWFRFFLQYNPQPTLSKLACPVLALNGEKDVQVIAKSNLEGIRAALQKSKSKFEVTEFPGLNHLFQTCKTCAPSEYFSLEETFSPNALEVMTKWLKKTSN